MEEKGLPVEILNLGSPSEDTGDAKKKNKKLTAALGVSGLAAVTGLGSTFAANISLNNNEAVEFGQGVTQTVACDEDGFIINPVTRYNNNISKFVIDYVEISGIDLTPKGTGWNADGAGSYADQTAAIEAHPGQYYNTDAGAWTNTCDGVVLDFKAYTDDVDYQDYAVDNNIGNPLYWSQYLALEDGDPSATLYNESFAVWINTTDSQSSYGSGGLDSNKYYLDLQVSIDGADSKFKIRNSNSDYAPFAGAISKFTVESMPQFPSTYDYWESGDYYWDTY